jgi:hypothetical protein
MDGLRRTLQVATLLAAGIVGTSAWSEAPSDKSNPAGSPVIEEPGRSSAQEPGAIDSQQSGRHFEAKKRERLLQMLRLDDATRAKFLERWEQVDKKSQDLRRERREAFSALREQIKSPDGRRGERKLRNSEKASAPAGSEAGLKKALERVYALEDAMAGLRRERFQIARDLLTPEQQGRFLMFNMKFHKEMLQRLEREQGGLKDKSPDPYR